MNGDGGACENDRKVGLIRNPPKGCMSPPVCLSIDLRLVARTVLDTLRLELMLDILGNTALHGNRIHATHIFI